MGEQASQRIAEYGWQEAPILVLRIDAEGAVQQASHFAIRTLGAGILGRPFGRLVVDFRTAWSLQEEIARGSNARMMTLSTATGLPESFLLRFEPLDHGLLVLGGMDVDELLRLQRNVLDQNKELADLGRQLQKANAELQTLDQLKNQFLGMAAHDLRTPVGLIMNYVELVHDLARERLTTEELKFLDTVIEGANRMKRIIDDFLNVAMIEAGTLPLTPHPTTVQEILDRADQFIRLIAEKKGVNLHVDPSEGPLWLEADSDKLCQVLSNLAGNAIEHSRPGQGVWLSAKTKEAGVEFEVRDEGTGIPETERERLFEPFVRAGIRKTANERSIGLGLAIARKIVDAHGGRIGVTSAEGKGSTFRFYIPSAPAGKSATPSAPR